MKNRLKMNLAIVTIVLIAFIVFVVIRKAPSHADQITSLITGIATMQYCTDGDSTSLCNPNSNLYSGVSTSNTVSISKTTSNLHLILMLRSDSNQTDSGTLIQIIDPTTQAVVAQATNQTPATDGNLTITDGTVIGSINDNTTSVVRVKAPGFLSKTKSITHILSQTQTWTTADIPTWGDLDNDNKLTLADLVTLIRAFNGGTDAGSQLVNATLDHSTTLPDIVTWIRNFNTNPNGS